MFNTPLTRHITPPPPSPPPTFPPTGAPRIPFKRHRRRVCRDGTQTVSGTSPFASQFPDQPRMPISGDSDRREPTLRRGIADDVRACAKAELLGAPRLVGLDRLHADVEIACDLLVGLPLRPPLQHLGLPPG